MLTPINFTLRGNFLLDSIVTTEDNVDKSDIKPEYSIQFLDGLDLLLIYSKSHLSLYFIKFSTLENLFDTSSSNLSFSDDLIQLKCKYSIPILMKSQISIISISFSSTFGYIAILTSDLNNSSSLAYLGIYSNYSVLSGKSWDESCIYFEEFDNLTIAVDSIDVCWNKINLGSDFLVLNINQNLYIYSIKHNKLESSDVYTVNGNITSISWSPSTNTLVCVENNKKIIVLHSNKSVICKFEPWPSSSFGKFALSSTLAYNPYFHHVYRN